MSGEPERASYSRRQVLAQMSLMSGGYYLSNSAAFAADQSEPSHLPQITSGVSTGEVSSDGAILWSRCDRPARLMVETSLDESFENAKRIVGPDALSDRDFTAKIRVRGFEPGTRVHYRIRFRDLDGRRALSEPQQGSFLTSPSSARDVTFVWSGDTAGQGFGIDASRGGMLTYQTMARRKPDFFIHSGDTCYADGPFPESMSLDDGSTWTNLTTPGTSKVAETLEEFRANHRYNLLDEHVREFNATVPMFAQWDDHETTNNWYPDERLDGDDRYQVKSAALLASRAKRAFFDYMPLGSSSLGREKIHRATSYGPDLDLFFLDLRSFRGDNSRNDQTRRSSKTAFMGRGQLKWLQNSLKESRATWKIICSDMPLGLIVGDGDHFENSSNGDGPAKGRELEIAELLRFIHEQGIQNTVWITADVHYAASHFYDPNQAVFKNFTPFWEFVSGPLHAGTFGPGKLDNTFGPQVKFCSIPEGMKPNRPPSEGLQFFGQMHLDGESKTLRVDHINRVGEKLWSVELDPKL